MNYKQLIKRFVKMAFGKRPIHMTANIVQLSPSELLKGRWALITGGSSGIGMEIAKAMLRAGASVIITGRNEKKLTLAYSILCQVANDDKRILYEVMDSSDVSSFQSHLQNMTNAKWGGVK